MNLYLETTSVIMQMRLFVVGEWEEADEAIKEGTLVVWSCKVCAPIYVRYCFDDASEGHVFSTTHLPVAPFRTNRSVFFDRPDQ